jgi:hypothetical protein
LNSSQKYQRAVGIAEREALSLIYQMESYSHGENFHYQRNQRELLLQRARDYSAAIRRLARLKP